MRSTCKTFAAGVLVGGSLFLSYGVISQDNGAPSHDEMMKMMEKLATPGPQHAQLAKAVGKWNQACTSWEPGVTEPEVSASASEIKSILGGRFVLETMKGTMNWGGGPKPFEGVGIHGYDNAKQKYFYLWLDSMGTGYMIGEGDADASGKVITYMSECDMGMGPMKVKSIARHTSDDENVFEMYMQQGDEWFKNMEINATRAAKAAPKAPASGH
jgi:hypothetical protein